MRGAPSYVSDKGIESLRGIVGNRIVVSIRKGRVRENGIFFDDAMIEYWPAAKRRRFPSNLAAPITGEFVSHADESWVRFAISRPIEVRGRRTVVPSGKPWWSVPPLFDYWPGSDEVASSVDIFEEDVTFKDGTSTTRDARIEIHFKDGQTLGFEAGALGWGYILIARGLRRPWGTRRSLRLRHRLN